MLFLSVRGFSDYAGSTGHSRLAQPAMLPSSCCRESRHPVLRVFEAQSPRPLIPLSTLRPAPRDADRKTQGQDGFAFSFLVGLFHPHQHAGLSRRSYTARRHAGDLSRADSRSSLLCVATLRPDGSRSQRRLSVRILCVPSVWRVASGLGLLVGKADFHYRVLRAIECIRRLKAHPG
jgi:hypothetical protein